MKHEFNNESWIDNRLHKITMVGGGDVPSSTQQQSTSTTEPWAGQQPYLQQAFQGAQQLYQGGGPSYYPGSTVAAPSAATTQSQQMEMNYGTQPNSTITAAQDATQNLLNPNFAASNPSNAMFGSVNPNNVATSAAQNLATNGVPGSSTLNGIAQNGNPNLAQQYLGSVADGSQINNNPTVNAQVAAANQQITNAYQTAIAPQIASAMEGAGRFGSGSAANAVGQGQNQLAGQLANADSSLYANAYNQATQNQLSAAQAIQQAQTAGTTQQLQAGSALGSNAINATNVFGQLGQGNIQNQLAAASGVGTNYSNDTSTQMKTLATAPSVASMPLSQAAAVADVGNQQNAYNQALLNSDVARYNFGQTAPYQNIATYEQLINGNYGGSTTTSSPYYYGSNAALLGNAATGAALGYSLSGGSGYGAAAGAMLPLIASA